MKVAGDFAQYHMAMWVRGNVAEDSEGQCASVQRALSSMVMASMASRLW